MSKNDSDDLSSFIEKEKISSSKLNLLKSYKYYCRCINQGIWDIYNKIRNIEGIILKKSLIVGSNMIFYVFWFLLSYTYNIQLTIFLTERAILLFTEYIIMSGNNSNSSGGPELSFNTNIQDAVIFAYKKTIGTIIPQFNDSPNLIATKKAAYDIKHIIQEVFLKTVLKENSNLDINIDLDIGLLDWNKKVTNNNTLLNDLNDMDSKDSKESKTDYFSKYNKANKGKEKRIKLEDIYNDIKDDNNIILDNIDILQSEYVSSNIENMIFYVSGSVYDFYNIFKDTVKDDFIYNVVSNIFALSSDNYQIGDLIVLCKIIIETFFDVFEKHKDTEITSKIIKESYEYFIKNKLYVSNISVELKEKIKKNKGNYKKLRQIALKY